MYLAWYLTLGQEFMTRLPHVEKVCGYLTDAGRDAFPGAGSLGRKQKGRKASTTWY